MMKSLYPIAISVGPTGLTLLTKINLNQVIQGDSLSMKDCERLHKMTLLSELAEILVSGHSEASCSV